MAEHGDVVHLHPLLASSLGGDAFVEALAQDLGRPEPLAA